MHWPAFSGWSRNTSRIRLLSRWFGYMAGEVNAPLSGTKSLRDSASRHVSRTSLAIEAGLWARAGFGRGSGRRGSGGRT